MKRALLNKIDERSTVLQSVAIWLIDNSQPHSKKGKRLDNFKLSVQFYLDSILAFVTIVSDSFLRLFFCLFRKSDSTKYLPNVKIGFIYFAKSHLTVLEKLIEEVDPNERILITSRTLKELLKQPESNSTFFIDGMLNIVTFSRTIRDIVIYILTERKATVNYFEQISGYDRNLFRKLIIKLFFSLRFKNLTHLLYSRYINIERIILGNDSCYRSFWLINYNNLKIKSCTIQHGIPENLIQYYSISEFFMVWDDISLDRLIKNEKVNYVICGYPKKIQNFTNTNTNSNTALIITTKICDEFEIVLLKKIISLLESEKLKVYIKLHPLESKEVILHFNPTQIFKSSENDELSKHILFLIDTTFAVDLKYSGLNFLPLTFDYKRTFNLYFDSIHVNDFIASFPKGNIRDFIKTNESRMKFEISQNNYQSSAFKMNGII